MLQIKKEKEENILKRKIFGRWRRRRNREVKEGKYLEKENILSVEVKKN